MGLFNLSIDTEEDYDFFHVNLQNKQGKDFLDVPDMLRKRDKKRGKDKSFCFEKAVRVFENFEESVDPNAILEKLKGLEKPITLDQITDKL